MTMKDRICNVFFITLLVLMFPIILSTENLSFSSISNMPKSFASVQLSNQSLHYDKINNLVLEMFNSDLKEGSTKLSYNDPILYQSDYNTNFKLVPNITDTLIESVPFKGNGTIDGIKYNHTGFFSGIWNLGHDVLQYYGAVNLVTTDGQNASYTVQGMSSVDNQSSVQGQGIALFNTNSNGSLAPLNGIIILYQDKIEDPLSSDSPHQIIGWSLNDGDNGIVQQD